MDSNRPSNCSSTTHGQQYKAQNTYSMWYGHRHDCTVEHAKAVGKNVCSNPRGNKRISRELNPRQTIRLWLSVKICALWLQNEVVWLDVGRSSLMGMKGDH